MTPHIQKAGRAIAEVRERYKISQIYDAAYGVFENADARPFVFGHDVERSQAECQAWIDEQMATASFESVLPVSDGMVKAVEPQGLERDCPNHVDSWRDEYKRIITAAIHAILGRGN